MRKPSLSDHIKSLLPLPSKVGVAVSGGMDSMVLVDLLMQNGLRPIVLNVEHGIRGESSLKDSAFVVNYALSKSLPIKTTSVDALSYAESEGISVELAARILRYGFFDSLLSSGEVDVIALAHHADDNAETILMRLFRGTGLRGLKGITERDGYIRPLLPYSREEIAAYAAERNIKYVEDETNSDSAYTRNFIRNELMPLIKSRYPNVIESFTRLSESADEADKFISSFCVPATPDENGYRLKEVTTKPIIVQKYSINAVLNSLGAVKDVEKVHLNAILDLKQAQNNSTLDMPFGITVLKYDDDLVFRKAEKDDFKTQPFDEKSVYVYGGYSYRFVKGDGIKKGATLDPNKVKGCVVRTREDGDKFCRVNGKNKLLSDFLNEKKLTKYEKDSLLVLAKKNVIYAILGLETAEQAKAENEYLHILKEKVTYDER